MRNHVLEDHQYLLLREAVTKHAAPLLALVQREMAPLTDEQREGLRQAVAAELGETGFTAAGPISERGSSLEDLIDLLGHL